ncbi:MAG: hypothetical protein QN141_09045 [Armatimonadota bacterium]|nr:hypothetical protein [Armatimonadota bacterium]MDR7467544.1 hypothetical protein [Armatimonadota bacterium]MDR7494495.1 hypothetical protein [Armatimonadota bacterium]MDR7504959.1 hypothetical protein [Armatimonadota bacterium]MDR7547727.1 hypothetical protein [Armatimonadota bacterium]
MASTRPSPRRDPVLLYRIQSDFAAGLAPAQIAEKLSLPVYTVTTALRRDGSPGALPDPYSLAQRRADQRDATLLYWVGYVAACGAVYDGPTPTVVIDLDPRDIPHVERMLADLTDRHPGCEFCQSSARGLQAYIRDRALGRLLLHWGIPDGSRADSVPLHFIPAALLPHFVRGYLEGGRGTPPFGGRTTPGSVGAIRRVVFEGPPTFLAALREALRPHVDGRGTLVIRRGTGRLTYTGRAAPRVVRFAYRDADRSLPRLDRLRQTLRLPGPAAQNGRLRARRG